MLTTVMDLEGYEAAVGEVLGTAIDPLSWPVEVIDAGLRAALREYEEAAPTVRAALQVVMGGIKQDLTAIGFIRKVAAIAWPWVPTTGAIFERPAHWVRFVSFDGLTVRFLDVEPAAGDWLLVRYWRRYMISGLDEAEEDELPADRPARMGTREPLGGGSTEGPPLVTNVPIYDQYLLVHGAAGHACTVRLRQLSEQPGVPARTAEELAGVRDGLLAGYAAGLAALTVGRQEGGVNWGNYGL